MIDVQRQTITRIVRIRVTSATVSPLGSEQIVRVGAPKIRVIKVVEKGKDGATNWNDLTGKPPLSLIVPFTNQSIIEITHNMQKYPSVRVEDSAGSLWIVKTLFPTLNSVRIEMSVSFSGRVILS